MSGSAESDSEEEKMDVDADMPEGGPAQSEVPRVSSNFISEIKDPSFCIESSHRPSDKYFNEQDHLLRQVKERAEELEINTIFHQKLNIMNPDAPK